jgi:uncharacterized protein YjbI with pentapeptide repeats/MFS family permease
MATKQKPKAPTWLIENIAEASKNARKIYFLYIGFLAYFGLTVFGTSDRQIILNETASLPFFGLEVSLNGFFIIAPLIAILVFVYLQLYLYRLKASIDDLRFNYASVEKRRLYPWMINIAEDPDPGFIGKLQVIMVKLSVWILLPLVLFLIAIWFVKKHDPFLSYIVGLSPILGAFVVVFFWCQYEDTQMREFFRRNLEAIFVYIVFFIISALLTILTILYMPKLLILFGISESLCYLIVGVAFIVVCCLLRCLYVKLRRVSWKHEGKTILVSSVLTFGALLIFIVIPYSNKGSLISVDLSHQKLVAEPEKDYAGLFWGNLSKAHLEGANLTSSILKRMDFRNAHLQHAAMESAILQGANLEAANLRVAYLKGANLQNANLGAANLRGAYLSGANLQNANLERGNLQGANLWGANLQNANLKEANIQKAFLNKAYLKWADLEGANLQHAGLDGANLLNANLKGAKLENAILEGAKLYNANLNEANLQAADLSRAELNSAWLQAADLRGAKNLTLVQLSKVETLYEAKLDPSLMEPMKKAYPRLFEEPTESKRMK